MLEIRKSIRDSIIDNNNNDCRLCSVTLLFATCLYAGHVIWLRSVAMVEIEYTIRDSIIELNLKSILKLIRDLIIESILKSIESSVPYITYLIPTSNDRKVHLLKDALALTTYHQTSNHAYNQLCDKEHDVHARPKIINTVYKERVRRYIHKFRLSERHKSSH